MDIKQKLNDAKLLIKNDRRVWAILGAVGLMLMLVVSSGDRKRLPRAGAKEQTTASQMTDQGESYKDLVKSFQQDLSNLSTNIDGIRQDNERSRREFTAFKHESEGLFQMFADRVENLAADLEGLKTNAAQPQPAQPQDNQLAQMDTPEMEEATSVGTFGFEESTVPPPPPAPPAPPLRTTFIAPGDSVKVKLLTGVAAPTDGTPYPVVFQLRGPIGGPDGSSLDLGEARLIAAAQGSEVDGRVIYRLTDLALRHRDGRRAVVKVDGWVVGEDGIRGMRGKVIDKLGQLIAATAGYSFVAALGESLEDQRNQQNVNNSTNITLTSDDLDSATASALTDASNRLGQLLVDKYEKQIPVVEVNAGRDGAAIFSRGAEVSIIEENSEDIYQQVSLD